MVELLDNFDGWLTHSEYLGFGNCHERHHRHVAYIIFHPNLNPIPQRASFVIPAHTITPAFKYVHLHLQLWVCPFPTVFFSGCSSTQITFIEKSTSNRHNADRYVNSYLWALMTGKQFLAIYIMSEAAQVPLACATCHRLLNVEICKSNKNGQQLLTQSSEMLHDVCKKKSWLLVVIHQGDQNRLWKMAAQEGCRF